MRSKPLVIMILLLAIVPSAALAGCGDESGARKAADELLQASKDGDCEKAAGYVDLERASEEIGIEINKDDLVAACEAEKEDSPLVDYRILGETEVDEGVEIEVELVNKIDDEEITTEDTILLMKIDGEWKVVP